MTVATTRYGHQTAPWDAPLSWGVQAFIEYNGYVINDRHQADRIRVTGITGLDDADISDAREVIPGDDGEIPYDAYYRGRTIMLTGRIEAGSLGALKRLERDLKAAFGPLVESPMKFRWFDVYDSFDDPLTLQNYTAQIGSAFSSLLVPANGVLKIGTLQEVMLLRTGDNRLWGDKQTTLRAIVGSLDSTVISVIPSIKDSSNYLKIAYTHNVHTLTISVVIAGATFQLASVPTPTVVQGQSIWIRGRTEGDLVTAEMWLSPPSESTLPDLYTTALMQGTDADILGDQVLTLAGFDVDTASLNWAVDDFKIESLAPGDVIFDVRKMPNGLSIKDSQDSLTQFNRAFQITARASKSFAACATQSRSPSFTPSALVAPTLGFTFPLKMPMSFTRVVSGPPPANTFVTVDNRGTVPVRPIIYIHGAISGLTMINLQNGMEIVWGGTLADGDYLVFDCAARTLVNSLGNNQMASFASSSSRWMQLEPHQNDIYLVGSGYSANTKMVVYWRHGLA